MPRSLQDRDLLPSFPVSLRDPSGDFGDGPVSSSIDHDPLAAGRGLVFGLLLSAVLLCGIVALVLLIWAV